MNLIELLLFLVLSFALLLFAQLLSRWLGTVGWFLGVAPLGVGLALFLFGTCTGMFAQPPPQLDSASAVPTRRL